MFSEVVLNVLHRKRRLSRAHIVAKLKSIKAEICFDKNVEQLFLIVIKINLWFRGKICFNLRRKKIEIVYVRSEKKWKNII